MSKQFKPLGERVLIRLIEPERKHGSLHLPENYQKDGPRMGIVEAVGVETDKFKFSVKVGDTILLPRYGGVYPFAGEENYITCMESDLIGIIPTN